MLDGTPSEFPERCSIVYPPHLMDGLPPVCERFPRALCYAEQEIEGKQEEDACGKDARWQPAEGSADRCSIVWVHVKIQIEGPRGK